MFITCVGGKRLQLLVRAELGSHDTVLNLLKLIVASKTLKAFVVGYLLLDSRELVSCCARQSAAKQES